MSSDPKASLGLANSLSNVFKLAEVNGLRWVRYIGPNSTTLEAPKDDPVLNSYAKLLNEGYACSWRRLSPSTDGVSGESKDLWIFFFTDLPDISDKLAGGLQEEGSGSWDDGMTPDSSTMLYRALHNLIERSLLSENFLPLGKWFARPDSSVVTDGSSRGCFLCSFSFFVHAHLYICAGVDMRAGPSLQPLLPSHLNQALTSSSGLQVILSPSGLNAVMTGHSYKTSDSGIDDILEEWKLFYPARFSQDPSPGLPAAIEVVLGGVRMRYPSQFVFVYHGEESMATLPPSPIEETALNETMELAWEMSSCADTAQRQRNSAQCRCQEMARASHSHRRQSSHLDLPLKSEGSRQSRYEPYPSSTTRSKARELATPGSLSLVNVTTLNTKKKLSRLSGLPKYTTPLSSPAIPPPPSQSPTPQKPPQLPLPTISFNSVSSTAGPRFPSICYKTYDPSRVPNLPTPTTPATAQYHPLSEGWWDCLNIPENIQSLQNLQLPRQEKLPSFAAARRDGGLPSPGVSSPGGGGSPSALSALLSPTSKRGGGSPSRRGRNSIGRSIATPSTPGMATNSPSEAQKLRNNKTPPSFRGVGRGEMKGSDVGIGIGSLDKILATQEEGIENVADSPVSADEEHQIMRTDSLDAFGIGASAFKPQTIDVFSDKAVKITDLDQIFDSDGEDEAQQPLEPSHFTFGSILDVGRGEDKSESSSMSKATKLAASDPVTLSELSRIYPTPPSVESMEEKYEEVRLAEEKGDQITPWDSSTACIDEELVCVPMEFSPLSNLSSFKMKLPNECIYTPPSPDKAVSSVSGSATSKTTSSSRSEPQKFIFPPPSTLATRAQKLESLNLPLFGRRSHITPHNIFTPQFMPSPAYLNRGHTPNPFHRHLSTPSVPSATPLESPFETVTPTPLSATTSSRLMPVLPEAHGLYINLALLDSALGANLSETISINTGLVLQKLMNFSNKRMKLDSIGSTSALDNSTSSTTGLLNFQEEKPVMTFGIADYPSLGFREELDGVMGDPAGLGNLAASYGSLSSIMTTEEGNSENDTGPVFLFLKALQDYCLHLCLSGCHGDQASYNSLKERSQHTHIMIRPPNRSDTKDEDPSSCRLYHSHSVVSAVLNAKQLVYRSGRKLSTPVSTKPTPVTLAKEDNSASWILELLTLPTKFISKRLKELRQVFQYSFHHAPCLKFSTKGPLSLKDLQQLAPSQTALGDECSPLPLQPVVVGYDYEWLSISPLAIPAWEKLLFEPYAMKKTIRYLVLAPSPTNFVPMVKKYIRNLSITFKNCNLGQHIPLEIEGGDEGILLAPTDGDSNTDDPQTSSRHGTPAGLLDVFKKILVSYFSSKNDHLLSALQDSTSSRNSHLPTPPVNIVLYVLCGRETGNKETFHVLRSFSELVRNSEIPPRVRESLVLQVLEDRDIFGQSSGRNSHLCSLAFSLYSRCHNRINLMDGVRSLTYFGPNADKLRQVQNPWRQMYAPPFILSPDVPLSSMGPPMGTQTHHILFNPEEAVLFCGYCVSPDQKWLLVVCCDRQGELLDTTIIGIQPADIDISRMRALQKLWEYLVSIVSGSLLKWNIVITRFGKPSNSEIKDWPNIVDDGLLTANQMLCSDCTTCSHTSSRPHFTNVLMLSMQPERKIQLFPTHDPNPSDSHVMVLPQDPHAAAAGPCLTPSATDTTGDDFDFDIGGASDNIGFTMDPGLLGDIGSELAEMDFGEDFHNTLAQGMDNVTPKATGYLISTSPTGELPDGFWGHDRPQTVCSMFKVLLHCHKVENSKAFPDSPQETLGSTLLCFNSLSWLTMDHTTRQRRSCLPIHLFILSKMYHLFSLLDKCR